MKNLNTRRWSTPATIGAGIFVVVPGLLMFFVAGRPFKFAHERIGIGFSIAILLHVMSHWRSFSNYFSERSVVALVWSIGIGLVTTSTILNSGDVEELIVERIDGASVALLAPVVGMNVRELVDRLGDDGFVVDDPGMSIQQLADQYGAETDDVLLSVFQ